MKKEICECGHEKKWHLRIGDCVKGWCKHKDKTYGVYDCICKKFKSIKINNEEEREK